MMCFPSTAHKVRARRVRCAQLALTTHSVRACVAQSEAAINSNESLLLESEQQRLRADNQLLHVEMERLDRIVYGRDASSVMPRCGATQNVPEVVFSLPSCDVILRAATSRVRDVCCMHVYPQQTKISQGWKDPLEEAVDESTLTEKTTGDDTSSYAGPREEREMRGRCKSNMQEQSREQLFVDKEKEDEVFVHIGGIS